VEGALNQSLQDADLDVLRATTPSPPCGPQLLHVRAV